MGGFNENNLPPPSVDYPPENAIDISSSFKMTIQAAREAGVIDAGMHHKIAQEPGWLMKEIIAAIASEGDLLGQVIGGVAGFAEPLLKALLQAILAAMDPVVQVGGDLANAFVGSLVASLKGEQSSPTQGAVTGLPPAAQNMFDGIMAPLMGLTAARDPRESGAGQQNAQYTLGALVAVQLHTWIINIVANLSGLGVLKYINSFDECVTGSLNARALGRGAMKPYMEKFIATPLTNDLNVAMPLDIGSTAQLVKRYLRGNIGPVELKAALRKRGFDDDVVGDMLLDAARLLDASAVVYLVKAGTWTQDQAIQMLVQAGYPASLAQAVYAKEYNSFIDSQMDSLAEDLLTMVKDHRMEIADFQIALQKAGFPAEEISAMQSRAAYAQEIPKRLSYTQVKSLYAESMVDLNYVTDYLTAEGYSPTDADLLVLLEFTKKQDRDQTIKLLAAIRRGTLEKQLGNVAAANAARQAALALLPS